MVIRTSGPRIAGQGLAWLMALGAMVASSGYVAAMTVPQSCTVAPRPVSEFVMPTDQNLAGGSRVIVSSEAELPAGTPATDADVISVQAFAELFTACQNAGDFRRRAALYSDFWFRDTLAQRMSVYVASNPFEALIGFLRGSEAAGRAEEAALLAQDVAAPPSPRTPPIEAVEVRGVRVLPDGRLGAILVQDGQLVEFQIYVREDGRLLLDQTIDIYPSATEFGAESGESFER
ncbi:MAG: hypothetical protein U0031_11360 [Thermomicrobiales bacterium]